MIIWKKIFSYVAIGVNTLLLLFCLELFYGYHFTNKLYLFMYPDWILITIALLAIIGICVSILLLKKRIRFGLFLILTLLIWLLIFFGLF